MAALFGGGNPLATPVGQKIERATDGSQASENWGLFMEVCDIINETDEGPKDAIKALKKRLTQNMGKNHTAVLYTLTCLESCVKNCGRRFHTYVANKDFLQDMVKVIGPKYDPPQAVQEKVLSLVQTWADAFKGVPDLKEVEKVYNDLKSKGIEFPMTDMDHMAPIHTPARTHGEAPDPALNRVRPTSNTRGTKYMVLEEESEPQQAPVQPMPVQMVPQGGGGGGVPAPAPVGPINPSVEQMSKLKSELNIVQSNIKVMGEMLTELSPSTVDPSDLELLQELNRTNRQMQQRLVELLDGIANEEITNELLRINDDCNNVFLRYERFERYRTGQTGQQNQPPQTQVSPEPSPQDSHLPPSYDQVSASTGPTVGNLIDLGTENNTGGNLSSQFSDMGLGSGSVSNTLGQINSTSTTNSTSQPKNDDFDMFAQSRQSFDTNRQNMSTGVYSNQQDDTVGGGLSRAVNMKTAPGMFGNQPSKDKPRKLQDKESEYDEMEQWLTDEQKKDLADMKQDQLTSSEFDEFLAERAAVAETLPSISAATGQQSRTNNRNRQLQKEEEENPLFAL